MCGEDLLAVQKKKSWDW